MNCQERDELLQFLQPLMRTRATDKDFIAERLILEQCALQPDALYILVQRGMALELALQAAQARVAELQASLQADVPSQEAARASSLAQEEASDRNRAWGRGLLAQASAIGAGAALGVAAGIVAGGLLLEAAEDGFSGDL